MAPEGLGEIDGASGSYLANGDCGSCVPPASPTRSIGGASIPDHADRDATVLTWPAPPWPKLGDQASEMGNTLSIATHSFGEGLRSQRRFRSRPHSSPSSLAHGRRPPPIARLPTEGRPTIVALLVGTPRDSWRCFHRMAGGLPCRLCPESGARRHIPGRCEL